jgi:adenine-specific DNA methylase
MSKTRRFIEDSFPVKEVSIESAREKNIRHGHISTLHIWWARRPLASSRATNYTALIPAPDDVDEWNKKRQFIIDFSKWENSLNTTLIKKKQDRFKQKIMKLKATAKDGTFIKDIKEISEDFKVVDLEDSTDSECSSYNFKEA